MRVDWSASSSYLLVGFCFQRLVLLSVRQLPDHLINAISAEEELGRAQSKPTLAKSFRSRLGDGQRPRSKVVGFVRRCDSFLFPSNSFV